MHQDYILKLNLVLIVVKMPKKAYRIHPSSSMQRSSSNQSNGAGIDKNRLAKAIKLDEKNKAACEFAWGDKVEGIDGIETLKTLRVDGLGDISLPVSQKVCVHHVAKFKMLEVKY